MKKPPFLQAEPKSSNKTFSDRGNEEEIHSKKIARRYARDFNFSHFSLRKYPEYSST